MLLADVNAMWLNGPHVFVDNEIHYFEVTIVTDGRSHSFSG